MRAIRPALVIKETILSHSSTQIAINTTKNKITDNKASVPGANKLPVIGKLMSGTFKDDSLSELLVFIAPRIL